MKEKTIIEDCNSSEISSSDKAPYLPTANFDQLEPDESVYSLLEYISLEWPSQSLDFKDCNLYVATNPANGSPKIIKFDLSATNNLTIIRNFNSKSYEIEDSLNRLRCFNNYLLGLSDNNLNIYRDFKPIVTKNEKFGYGLAFNDTNIVAGLRNGNLKIFDHELNDIKKIKLHTASIESIKIYENCLFTASCDKTSKGYDTRSENVFFDIKNDCDFNAIDVTDNKVILGDDKGRIKIVDLRNNLEENIEWHKSPISYVKYKNNTEFISCSDEQVALWDMSFEEEWDYHKYLRFVHQGQKFYKEAVFVDETVITTSYDGLCFFKLGIE